MNTSRTSSQAKKGYSMKRYLLLAALTASTALLGGCWDDDEAVEETAATNEVPDSALTSSEAFTAYVGSLALSETAPPVDVSKITTAPSSETAPPAPVN
jgi:hypothetical protein